MPLRLGLRCLLPSPLSVADARQRQLEAEVGHPGERQEQLLQRVQDAAITQFTQVQTEWMDLMWCLDRYRIETVAPRGMGNPKVGEGRRIAAIYRMKGNWFARLVAALLQNRTRQEIAAKGFVQGFSQPHQVDVAWPPRERDPLVCIETKVTGAPAYGDTPSRSALADYSNRRKEVKFTATDLKLFRRQQDTVIEHWGVWRAQAPPKTYFLWAARLRGGRHPDQVDTMIREAQVLVSTYLEGAGILAWRDRADGKGYEVVPVPQVSQVTALDDVLYRVQSEIKTQAPRGEVPPPQVPEKPVEGAETVMPGEKEE